VAVEDIRERLKRCSSAGEPAGLLDLTEENAILSFAPEDMTVRVQSGVRLNDLQARLAEAGQWLPLDPWDDSLTLKRIIDDNLYGPGRYGYGTVREHLIGMEMLLADGRLIQSGGNVVKNVAGYDLMKLFVGARQSLGLVVTATFKLLPVPECRRFFQAECGSENEAAQLTARLLESELCPVALDWHRLKPGSAVKVVIGFAGTEQEVDWQVEQLNGAGMNELESPGCDREFFTHARAPKMSSVLPSNLGEAIARLEGEPFVARAGNGVLWASKKVGTTRRNRELEVRLKSMFDPENLFPDLPAE